jgi:hypothetical protein
MMANNRKFIHLLLTALLAFAVSSQCARADNVNGPCSSFDIRIGNSLNDKSRHLEYSIDLPETGYFEDSKVTSKQGTVETFDSATHRISLNTCSSAQPFNAHITITDAFDHSVVWQGIVKFDPSANKVVTLAETTTKKLDTSVGVAGGDQIADVTFLVSEA